MNIASFVGQGGSFGRANYAASKEGIIALTKVLPPELAKSNIAANVVSPGFTSTDMTAAMPPDVAEQIKVKNPSETLRKAGRNREGSCIPYLRRRLHHRPPNQRKRRPLRMAVQP